MDFINRNTMKKLLLFIVFTLSFCGDFFAQCPPDTTFNQSEICIGDRIFLQGNYQTNTGTYYDTLQNMNGCDSVIITTLTVNQNPAVSVTTSDASCAGCCNGAASVSASGTFPFLYQWENGMLCTNCSNLCPGIYKLTVTDSKGCSTVTKIGVGATTAQISSSCCTRSILKMNYDDDVSHMAFDRIVSIKSPYKYSIEIPQSFQDTIWEGLSAIFNLANLIERDTVFDIYCIDQYPSILNNQIYVAVDTSFGWTQNWQNLITITGIAGLDSLLAKYGFTVTDFTILADTLGNIYPDFATLTTDQNINVQPVCDSIEFFSGVNYSEPKPYIGDGDRIDYAFFNNAMYCDFSIGYGDCPSGCTSRRYYNFKVYPDCSVSFLGAFYGGLDPFPSPINCNISANLFPVISANGSILTSNSATSNQWYLNDTIISGANSQNYSVTQNGNYTVVVTDSNGCSATSAAYNFTSIGFPELTSDNSFIIIPNPGNGKFQLYTNLIITGKIKIYNVIGDIIFESAINDVDIDLSNQPRGIYSVEIMTQNKILNKKIVIQ